MAARDAPLRAVVLDPHQWTASLSHVAQNERAGPVTELVPLSVAMKAGRTPVTAAVSQLAKGACTLAADGRVSAKLSDHVCCASGSTKAELQRHPWRPARFCC